MAAELLGLIQSEVRASKVENYEIYITSSNAVELHLRRSKIELTNHARFAGFSTRVLDRGIGVASSTILSEAAAQKCIRDAVHAARNSEPVSYSFPTLRPVARVDIFDRKLAEDPEAELNRFAGELIETAEKQRVELTFAKVKAFDVETAIANSEDLSLNKRETYFSTEVSFKGNSDRPSECWVMRYARRPEDITPEKVEEWAVLAANGSRAMTPQTRKCEILFPPNVVCDLLVPVLSLHASAEALKLGISKLNEGEEVAASELTILDDGLYPMALTSSPFDDEGNSQRTTVMLERGVFRQRIYDQLYGQSYGVGSTGNGIRQAFLRFFIADKFATPPSCQSTNIRVLPGGADSEELLREMDDGVVVYNFSWLAPDEVTGNFAAEIRNGFMVESGEVTTPLKGGVVSGNVFELMKKVTGLGNSVDITSGQTAFSCISPYMRFGDLQVSGG